MVWYGIVWYGMVWHGWYGMVWYGWYGMVWYGMVWYGMVWCGMVWLVWYGMVGMVWYGMETERVGSVAVHCILYLHIPIPTLFTQVNWHPVFWGFSLQFYFACLILRTQWGHDAFEWLGDRVTEFLAYSDEGAEFVFGQTFRVHFFAFSVSV